MAGRTCRVVAVALVGALVTAACSSATVQTVPPGDRAVELATTGCGYAAGRTGSGTAIGDGLIVTVAHLVVQADAITVTVGGVDRGPAAVIGIDRRRDLAALRLSGSALPAVETAQASTGTTGTIVGGAVSGNVDFAVKSAVEVSIEEVLGTTRHKRRGYQLDAGTARGDSGAGAYDEAGRLIGIVFAYSEDPRVTWVTSSREVVDFLTEVESTDTAFACNPEQSRLDAADR